MRRTPRNVIVFTMTFLMILGSLGAWAASVTPTVIPGADNPGKNCTDVYPGVAGLRELKIEPVPEGTSSHTYGNLSVQVVKPSVEEGSVNSFDFTANLLVLGVVVKDGVDGANFYDYSTTPEGGSTADTYLTTPFDGAKGISHISFCYGYQPLTATKTAAGSYDRTVTWELDKTVEPASHTGFAGEVAGSSTWTVEATKTEVKSNFHVSGTITVTNPNEVEVPVSVADTLSDGTVATVTCPVTENTTGVVPAATAEAPGSLTCSYNASPTDASATLNTAVITSELAGVRGATATAPVSFDENLIGYDSGTLTDARFKFEEVISDDYVKRFLEEFECSGDTSLYENGEYSYTVTNEALLDSGIDLQADATVAVTCTLPPLEVTKTAAGTYDRTVEWTLDKSVDIDSLTGFAGQSFDPVTWSVVAEKSETLGNYWVAGTVEIYNPAAIPQSFTISDYMEGINEDNVPVTCPAYTVQPDETITCTYGVPIRGATLNTAIVTAAGNPPVIATAEVPYTENLIGYDSGTLTDARFKFEEVISDDYVKRFLEEFECSGDTSLYENGEYSYTVTNEALLDSGIDLQADATVAVTCTLPPLEVTKTAAGTYDRTVEWTLDKSVDIDSLTGFAGQSFDPVTWSVVAEKSETLGNYWVAGTVEIYNPAAIPQSFTISDYMEGINEDNVPVTCPAYTVQPDETITCTYGVPIRGATLNTAIVTAAGNPPVIATAEVPYTENLIGYDSGTLTDARFKFEEVISGSTTEEFSEGFVCPPADSSLYENGVYEFTETNTAHLNDNINLTDSADVTVTCYLPAAAKVVKTTTEGLENIGQFPFRFELYDPSGERVETKTLEAAGEVNFNTEIKTAGTWKVVEVLPEGWVSQDDSLECTFEVAFPASAGQTYTCEFDNVEMSRVDLLKLTNGVETTTQMWSFVLYAGPDGFGTEALASDSTPPALLGFGNLNLDPAGTYTLCELEVPAGYSTFWQVDTDGDGIADATVVPYNPNADDEPSEDLGNRCVDIGFGTNIPLVPGETLHFVVDNQMPGGAPRTPGYWKNWNRCTGGGQQYTADANGGWAEGFWLLEDVLDPDIGGGIIWDDILLDKLYVPIAKCEVAVDILDKRLVGDEDVVGDGKKVASDPLHNLATHLLAAQLNFGAGACTTQGVLDAALDAETLLDKYDFNGNTHKKLDRKSPDIGLAGYLAGYLDDYNNGEFCGDGDGS
jgi:hypothetical protein